MRRQPVTPFPRWVLLPAALGALLTVLPVLTLLLQVRWDGFWELVTSPSSRDALALSLRSSALSTVCCVVLGVPMALVLARSRTRGEEILRALTLLPLVLPPVVAGMALLYLFGRRGLLGHTLEVAGAQIAFTGIAVVMAQTFVALPFMVLSLEGALRTTGTEYEAVAATLGASPGRTLWRVTIPLLAPALGAGLTLAFARALGEFGATLTFAGSLQGVTRTLPLEVYLQRESDPDAAVALSVVLIGVAFLIMVIVRPGRTQ